jgi:hypothetical protein
MFWNLVFRKDAIIDSVGKFFLQVHYQCEAWWFKLKSNPKVDADLSLPLDEAPGKYCLPKLLESSMHDR